VWTEYLDPDAEMSGSTSSATDYQHRDYNGGYKVDMGYIPDARVVTVGPLQGMGDVAGGSVLLAAEDTGDLSRNAASPLTLRFRHPNAFLGFYGERYTYATYRYRSSIAATGVALNDVPHNTYTAGNSRLVDSTPFTGSLDDSDVEVGSSYVVRAADGSYLVENTGLVRTPAGSTDARDNAVALRINKIAPATLATPEGLGCFGVTCQGSPAAPTAVSLPCVSDPSATASVTVPVSDLGYPSLFAVSVPDLATRASTSPQQAVTARLCVPAAQASAISLALAGYTEPPLAEMLTASALGRGNAPYLGNPVYSAGVGYDMTCRTVSFYVTSDGPRFLAALARVTSGSYFASSASAPAPLSMTLSCAAPASGAAATPYGAPAAVVSNTNVSLVFSTSFFSGAYYVDPVQQNGAPMYTAPGRFRIAYGNDGYWYIFTPDLKAYYSRQADPAKNLAALTSFGGMTFAYTAQCPAHALYYTPASACLPCPMYSSSRGGGSISAATDSLASACTCNPGYYMQQATDGTGRFQCVGCAAGTFKERPGNSGTDATAGCVACPSGWTSAAGSATCVPVSTALTTSASTSAGTSTGAAGYVFCKAYTISGWRSGWTGTYTLDTTTTASATTRDGWGESVTVYTLAGSAHMMIVDASSRTFYFSDDRNLGNWYFTVLSGRPPQAWTSAEWTGTYPAAAASCLCPAYGAFAANGGCACPAGQTPDAASGRCKDALSGVCPAGYTTSGGGCVDTNECAANNGGCSHTCSNTAGSRTCSCPTGWGVDAGSRSTCSRCADDQYVDAGTGVCTACPATQRRTAAGTGCGCPLGSVLTASGACVLPSDVTIDVWSTAAGSTTTTPAAAGSAYPISAAPFRGRFAACQPASGSGVSSSDSAPSVRVWQQVASLPGAAAPSAAMYLVYDPAAPGASAGLLPPPGSAGSTVSGAVGVWSLYSGAYPASAGGTTVPRYAYVPASSLNLSAAWPGTVSASGASAATAAAGMLPAGIQQWNVFTPHPAGGFAPAWLSLTASASGAGALSSLPTCGAVTAASADAAPKQAGASTLGNGPGSDPAAPVVAPSVSPTAAPTPSGTASPSASRTPTATPSRSGTPSATRSGSPSGTPSQTSSASASLTQGASPSSTATQSPTPSVSASAPVSATASPSGAAPAVSTTASPTPSGAAAAASPSSSAAAASSTPSPTASASKVKRKWLTLQAQMQWDVQMDVQPTPAPLGTDLSRVALALCVAAGEAVRDQAASAGAVSANAAGGCLRASALGQLRTPGRLRRLATAQGASACDPSDPLAACDLVGFSLSLGLNDTVVVTDPAVLDQVSDVSVGETASWPTAAAQSQVDAVNAAMASPQQLLASVSLSLSAPSSDPAAAAGLDSAAAGFSASLLSNATVRATSAVAVAGPVTSQDTTGNAPAPGSSPAAGSPGGGSLSTGAIIGIAVGGAALVIVAVAAVVAVVLSRKQRQQRRVAVPVQEWRQGQGAAPGPGAPTPLGSPASYAASRATPATPAVSGTPTPLITPKHGPGRDMTTIRITQD